MAIFGGNAETAALWFKKVGHEAGFFWLVAGIMATGFLVALGMRKTERHGLIQEEGAA